MLTLYTLLHQMKQRLGMYIEPPTLPALVNFLTGYQLALYQHNLATLEHSFLRSIHDFTAQKLGYSSSTAGFANMILAHICGFHPQEIIWEDFFNHPISNEQHQQAIELLVVS